jgi:hypothetical protein
MILFFSQLMVLPVMLLGEIGPTLALLLRTDNRKPGPRKRRIDRQADNHPFTLPRHQY